VGEFLPSYHFQSGGQCVLNKREPCSYVVLVCVSHEPCS
jgi:hypothetical protein